MTSPGRRLFALTLAGAIVLALGACTGGGGNADPTPTQSASSTATPSGGGSTPVGDASRGATLFAESCSACHGANAKGLPGLGKDLVQTDFVNGQSDEELVAFIKKGRDPSDPLNTTGVAMPPKGGNPALDDAKLYDIVAYLRSLEA